MVQHGGGQTFLGPPGRRRVRLRAALILLGLATTGMVLTVLIGTLFPPLLPNLPLVQTAADSLGPPARTPPPPPPPNPPSRPDGGRLAGPGGAGRASRPHPADLGAGGARADPGTAAALRAADLGQAARHPVALLRRDPPPQ